MLSISRIALSSGRRLSIIRPLSRRPRIGIEIVLVRRMRDLEGFVLLEGVEDRFRRAIGP